MLAQAQQRSWPERFFNYMAATYFNNGAYVVTIH